MAHDRDELIRQANISSLLLQTADPRITLHLRQIQDKAVAAYRAATLSPEGALAAIAEMSALLMFKSFLVSDIRVGQSAQRTLNNDAQDGS